MVEGGLEPAVPRTGFSLFLKKEIARKQGTISDIFFPV